MLYRGTKLVISGILLAGVGALLFGALSQPAHNVVTSSAYGSSTLPASADAILTKCGDVFLFDSEEKWSGTVSDDYKEKIPRHPMLVPVYGYMSDSPFDQSKLNTGTLTESVYTYPEILRAMWEGNHIIWVGGEYTAEGYEYLTNYAAEWNEIHDDKVVVTAWDFEYGMPGNRDVAFGDWEASQTCESFSESSFEDFQEVVQENTSPRDFQNPPAAVLVNNLLPIIDPQP